jgi:hypothetical protein
MVHTMDRPESYAGRTSLTAEITTHRGAPDAIVLIHGPCARSSWATLVVRGLCDGL